MKPPTLPQVIHVDNLAVHPGECLTVFLHDKTQIIQVELRVTAEGKAEVFAGPNVQEFKKVVRGEIVLDLRASVL